MFLLRLPLSPLLSHNSPAPACHLLLDHNDPVSSLAYLLFQLAFYAFQPFLMSDASDVLRYARWCVAARRSRAVVLAGVLGDVAKRAAGPAAVDATLSASERTA